MDENDICTASKTFDLAPHTEVEIGCGLTREQHTHTHMTSQTVKDVLIAYRWAGNFKEDV